MNQAYRGEADPNQAGGSHARCVLVVECSEESGSTDLPADLDRLGDRLGTPSPLVKRWLPLARAAVLPPASGATPR